MSIRTTRFCQFVFKATISDILIKGQYRGTPSIRLGNLNEGNDFTFILRDCEKINSVIMAQEFCPPARRKRRAYPASGSVKSEQRSLRAKGQARIAEVVFARSLN